jgi:TonB family protein
MLTYRKLANRRDMTLFLVLSLALHLMLLLLLKRNIPQGGLEHIDEITFIDPTLPEGVKAEPAKRGILDMFFQKEEVVSGEPGPAPLPDAEPTPLGIDLTPKDMDRSQAAISLDQGEGPDGITEVIRVAKPGEGKSTQDILAQAPISVSGGKSMDKGDFGGLFSTPGGASGPALEIDQGKKVEKTPEDLARAITKAPKKEEVTAAPVAKASYSITGALRDRKVLRKILPEYPEWAQQKGATAIVALHLSVDPDGSVQTSIFVEQTSGSGEWDREVVSALRSWRFAPLGSEVAQEVQDGVVTFRFTL